MQRVKIADIEVTKGKGEKGDWTKTTVVAEDGGRFSGFDTKLANLTKGSVIDIEPEIKGKYINIKEWKIISEAVAGQPIAVSSAGGWQARQDSPETRASIESQKRADIIMQGWIAGKLKDDDPLVAQMKSWLSISPSKGEGKAETTKANGKPVFQKSAEKVTEPAKVTAKAEQAEIDSRELFEERGSKGLSAEEHIPGAIDMDWLKTSLKELGNWSEGTFKTWLVSIGRKQQWEPIDISGTLTEFMGKLNAEQREFICKEIQERLDLK